MQDWEAQCSRFGSGMGKVFADRVIAMAQESERKFLVEPGRIRFLQAGLEIVQGYVSATPGAAVRIRVAGAQAWITLKGESWGAALTS
jgi:CYTH domain-containing protein